MPLHARIFPTAIDFQPQAVAPAVLLSSGVNGLYAMTRLLAQPQQQCLECEQSEQGFHLIGWWVGPADVHVVSFCSNLFSVKIVASLFFREGEELALIVYGSKLIGWVGRLRIERLLFFLVGVKAGIGAAVALLYNNVKNCEHMLTGMLVHACVHNIIRQ